MADTFEMHAARFAEMAYILRIDQGSLAKFQYAHSVLEPPELSITNRVHKDAGQYFFK
jgi:hypothetical protein